MPLDGNPRDYQTEQDEVVRVLRRAAQEVRLRGLAKGTQEDAQGRVCVHGAIAIAAGGHPDGPNRPSGPERWEAGSERRYCLAGDEMVQFLKERGDLYAGATGAAYWNNKRERTAAEVISALEAAADRRARSLAEGKG